MEKDSRLSYNTTIKGRFMKSIIVLVFALISCSSNSQQQEAPKPPEQPKTGPGGSEYKHQEIKKSVYGKGDSEFWIFEPAKPSPKSAPIVIFLHGWGGMNPKHYGTWIEHIVKRGNLVIYPRYQANLLTRLKDFTPNTIKALKDAFKLLNEGKHIKPDLEKVAVVGHSLGGALTANVAALASSEKLPLPLAVMSVQPGKSWGGGAKDNGLLVDLSKIPEKTLLLTVAGDKDTVVEDVDAKRIFKESTNVPLENKNHIIVVSDDHGKPPLKADHFSPCAPKKDFDSKEKTDDIEKGLERRSKLTDKLKNLLDNPLKDDNDELPLVENDRSTTDALDYYGTWKLFDALCDAAFYGKNREYALGNTKEQRFMGKWSDGTPVKELTVKEKLED